MTGSLTNLLNEMLEGDDIAGFEVAERVIPELAKYIDELQHSYNTTPYDSKDIAHESLARVTHQARESGVKNRRDFGRKLRAVSRFIAMNAEIANLAKKRGEGQMNNADIPIPEAFRERHVFEILEAIDSLSDEEQEIVTMMRDGVSAAEMAKRLNIPARSARRKFHSVYRRICELIQP